MPNVLAKPTSNAVRAGVIPVASAFMASSCLYSCPPDCTEEEWAFVSPALTLLPGAKRGFVLLPRRSVVERSFA